MQHNNPSPVSGEIIRKLRLLKGGKQRAIGKKMGFTQQAYSKIECCKRVPVHKLSSILIALGSSEAELQSVINFYPPRGKIGN